MADRTITAVAFDLGGVLLDWDPRHLYRKLIDDPVRLTDFLGRICTPQWHRSHDLGTEVASSCRELARQHPEDTELIMAWAQRGEEMIAGVFHEVVEILAELHSAGLRCFALSNMEPEAFARRQARYPFFGLFEGCVISGVEGVAKPDRAIFEILLSRYGLSAGATAFVDDLPQNVAAAGDLGIAGIEYTSAGRLRYDLRELGLPVGASRADGQAIG